MSKVIIVTGASRGIGRNIAYNLALDGYIVIANYNNSENEIIELKNELMQKNINLDIYKADVSKSNEARNLINYVIERYKKIDVLINNAGIAEQKLFTDISDDDFDKMLKNNLYSAFYSTQETVKHMVKEHSGLVINISSIYGLTGGSCEVHYSTAKAGVIGMTKALAKELGPSNIRINSIAPGLINTDMNKKLNKETIDEIKNVTPLNRVR